MGPGASTGQDESATSGARFLPLEVEPREGQGGGPGAPATRPSWVRRTQATIRSSVWAPVATKIFGLALALLVLSGVGLVSISRGPGGVRVPLADMLGGNL